MQYSTFFLVCQQKKFFRDPNSSGGVPQRGVSALLFDLKRKQAELGAAVGREGRDAAYALSLYKKAAAKGHAGAVKKLAELEK